MNFVFIYIVEIKKIISFIEVVKNIIKDNKLYCY